jgi:hypothetical protein
MIDFDGEELLQKLNLLKQELLAIPYWTNGSVIESVRKQNNKEKPFYYLSQSIKGKNKTTYISALKLQSFKDAVAQGEQLRIILAKINEINIQLIKGGSNDA